MPKTSPSSIHFSLSLVKNATVLIKSLASSIHYSPAQKIIPVIP